MAQVITQENNGIVRYQAMAIRQGLRAIKVGMRVARGYTPTACMRTASRLTNQKFKPRDYDAAIKALTDLIETGDACHG